MEALKLTHVDSLGVFLADRSRVEVEIIDCEIIWDGNPRSVTVHCMEGDPLPGMG